MDPALPRREHPASPAVPAPVRRAEPTVWRNPNSRDSASVLAASAFSEAGMRAAEARWRRFDPLLARLFDGLGDGRIDSPLLPLPAEVARTLLGDAPGSVWVKADHQLPVTGCIKARGGVYEVLTYVERLAEGAGLLRPEASYAQFASDAFRDLFSGHTIAVGSTGNLGFSVGVMGRALGFQVEVHMSHDAKAWKKRRLRDLGARVVEHPGDYGLAVAAARDAFGRQADAHFVDDESSVDLFLGYAAAAIDLRRQLGEAGIVVDAAHPLYVYLPCGVGGAPGGVTFGLKCLFGEAVRMVFVEPVASPCMLVQLAAGLDRPVSVYDVGLDNRTLADGLAVARASMLVARTVGPLIEAIVTVADPELFRWLNHLWTIAGLRLEPSAASGFVAVGRFLSEAGPRDGANATHVVWTTGGAHLPDAEFEDALARA